MHALITAGNTQVSIDRVRVITNIFTGRTGAQIALEGHSRGHAIELATSSPDALADVAGEVPGDVSRWVVRPYRTFDELETLLAERLKSQHFDAVIHTAAVSDYRSAGIYAPAPGTQFREEVSIWSGNPPTLALRDAPKVKSDEREL